MSNVVGDLIRRRRTALGLSQTKLGQLVGVSQVAISEWERGVVLPSKGPELADAIGVSREEVAMAMAAGWLSDDPVEQAIRQQTRLPQDAREALVTVYRHMLPSDA